MKLFFHPDARAELREATAFYRQESVKIADRFKNEVKSSTQRIARKPLQFPVMEHGYRRAVLRVFPYAIFFEQIEGVVHIIAVAHTSRFPGYWRDRVLPPS